MVFIGSWRPRRRGYAPYYGGYGPNYRRGYGGGGSSCTRDLCLLESGCCLAEMIGCGPQLTLLGPSMTRRSVRAAALATATTPVRSLRAWTTAFLLAAITIYQQEISASRRSCCPYTPSCSAFTAEALSTPGWVSSGHAFCEPARSCVDRGGAVTAAPAVGPVGVSGRPRRSPFRDVSALAYLVPALIIFVSFFFIPLGRSIYLSFQRSDIFGRPSGFVGLKHYLDLFTDPYFGRTLLVTLGFTVLTVVPSILIGLLLALLLQNRIRAVKFFRTAFALPFAFSVATAAVLFGVMLNPATGVFNGLLSGLGLGPVGWLTDPSYSLLAVALTSVWMQVGYNLLVLAAGLGAVPDDVVEAARLDGASGFRLQLNVIMPLVSPQLFFLAVTGTIQALQSFGQIHILTRGGPDRSTTTLVYSIYDTAFANNNSNFGAGSAQAIVLLVVVLAITAFQFGFLERKVFYS